MSQAAAPPATALSDSAFGPLRQVHAGLLDVGYVDAGPADGPAVVLLHGWPYDIHSYVDVVPLLTAAGYRALVPYLRGYGATRFLSDETSATENRRRSRSTSSTSWTRWSSTVRSWRVSTGELGQPTSSLRPGRVASGGSSR